jgi:hypothetical protein
MTIFIYSKKNIAREKHDIYIYVCVCVYVCFCMRVYVSVCNNQIFIYSIRFDCVIKGQCYCPINRLSNTFSHVSKVKAFISIDGFIIGGIP